MDKGRILIIEDDKNLANVINLALTDKGYETTWVSRGSEGLAFLEKHRPMAVLLDVRLPDMDGPSILNKVLKMHPQLHVLMMSAHASIEVAVDCIKAGAYDFIEKPFRLEILESKMEHIREQYHLSQEVHDLRRKLGEKYKFKDIVGKSSRMRAILTALDIAARRNINVLITGESGTGKELLARAIHQNSAEHAGPFVPVNCIAIPDNLLESELFGHEKGSFTGATQRRIGKFEQAQDGTIFLDEIGDLSMDLQGKLLRVIQEREIVRVGGNEPVALSCRFIFATNKNLAAMVQNGQFREDLYFRINVLPIRLPPLRERREDIPELLTYFLQRHTADKESLRIDLEPGVIDVFMAYAWPGNVREVENFAERIVAWKGTQGPLTITRQDAEAHCLVAQASAAEGESSTLPENAQSLNDAEKFLVEKTLRETHGNISKSAERLRISRQTLYRKMHKYAIAA